ncbi:hypothetical protein GN956_G2856 [Arapaima gigas]
MKRRLSESPPHCDKYSCLVTVNRCRDSATGFVTGTTPDQTLRLTCWESRPPNLPLYNFIDMGIVETD